MAPASSIPPALPPSVEEAYRRKCIQLKARTKEVEEANDAARLRLHRLKRQVEKMRLERAFLLEQLAKRTSTNVEDSDGSPSPPPTVRNISPDPSFLSSSVRPKANPRIANHSSPQPKEKPLRIKRGHRKPATGPDATPSAGRAGGAGASNLSVVDPASPTSETAISQNRDGETVAAETQSQQDAQGGSEQSRKPATAFELYCSEERPVLAEKSKTEDGDEINIEDELAKQWTDLPEKEKEVFEARAKEAREKAQKEDNATDDKDKDAATPDDVKSEVGGQQTEDTPQPTQDEDVEMANYDTDQETQGEKPEEQ